MAIARALIKQAKILVFDEATINQLKGKVSMLFITHAKGFAGG